MRSGITACEWLTFLPGIYPNIYVASRDSGYLRCCSSKV